MSAVEHTWQCTFNLYTSVGFTEAYPINVCIFPVPSVYLLPTFVNNDQNYEMPCK